jgi:hypothetical protein
VNLQKNKFINFINLKFFLSIFILLVPFLEFVKQNINEVNNQVIVTLISLLLIFLLIGFAFAKFLEIFTNFKFSDYLFFYTTSFFLIFKWNDLNNTIQKFFSILFAQTSLVIIFISIILLFYFLIIKKSKILRNFLINFFLIYFLYLTVTIIKNYEITELVLKNNQSTSLVKQNNKTKNNIYYIILDGAMSLERFEYLFDEKLNFIEKIDKNNFRYIENTHSSYFDTGLSLGSFFNMSYITLEDDYNPNYLYPRILYKKNYKFVQPKLLKILKNQGYEFVWYSNEYMDCKMINDQICGKKNTHFSSTFINFYVFANFIKSSPILAIINKINPNILIKRSYYSNDSIKDFLNNAKFYKDGKQRFFFIHAMMPHAPFVYGKNCEITDNRKKLTVGYKMNYFCTINRVKEFKNYISKYDKNSIVIIQGDHGYFFKNKKVYNLRNDKGKYVEYLYNNNQKELLENFKIFNLIKLNDNCKFPKETELDNVNSALLITSCATGVEQNFLKKRTFLHKDKEVDY